MKRIYSRLQRQQTALHLAAEHGYSEVTEVLLSHGADLSVPEKVINKAMPVKTFLI